MGEELVKALNAVIHAQTAAFMAHIQACPRGDCAEAVFWDMLDENVRRNPDGVIGRLALDGGALLSANDG